MNKKKLATLALAFVLAASSVVPALAYTTDQTVMEAAHEDAAPLAVYQADNAFIMGSQAEIVPYWNSTSAIFADLSINWLGKATASVTYSTWNGKDSVYLTVKIRAC